MSFNMKKLLGLCRRVVQGYNLLWHLFIVLLVLFLFFKAMLSFSRAQAYSALASLTGAIYKEINTTNGFQNVGFLPPPNIDWMTLSDEQCELVMRQLKKKYSVEGAPSFFGLFDYKVQIEYKIEDGMLFCRVGFREPYNRNFEYKEFNVPMQDQQFPSNEKQLIR